MPTKDQTRQRFEAFNSKPLATVRRAAVVEQARNRLGRDFYLSRRNIVCEYYEGVLILRGRLPTYYLKQLAQCAVAGLRGVEQIVNNIEVSHTDG